METRTHAPSFTVSLRGYDREEVDEYLDSLAEALTQIEEAEERTRRLQSHVARCNARIKELEDRIRSDTPKSGVALGERIGILLREAEEAAAETVAKAGAEAIRVVAAAEQRVAEVEANARTRLSEAEAKIAEADEHMRATTAAAEEQARRIEAVARGEATEIVAEAESRSAARTRQIEQWADQVVSHTRAEEARMVSEHEQRKADALDEHERAMAGYAADLQAMEERKGEARATLMQLHEMVGRSLGLIEEEVEEPAAVAGEEPAVGGGAGEGAKAPALGGGEAVVGGGAGEGAKAPALVEEPPPLVETNMLATEPSAVGMAYESGSSGRSGSSDGSGESHESEPTALLHGGLLSDIHMTEPDMDESDAPTPPYGTATIDRDFEAKLDAWMTGEA